MNLQQMEYIVALDTHRHFVKAAQSCGVSQPTLSTLISKLEEELDTVIFDKTGTLTKGVFKVAEVLPAVGFTKELVLEYAAKAESYSNHPIAKSITSAFGKEVDPSGLTDYQEISGHGVRVTADHKRLLAGNRKLMEAEAIHHTSCNQAGRACRSLGNRG